MAWKLIAPPGEKKKFFYELRCTADNILGIYWRAKRVPVLFCARLSVGDGGSADIKVGKDKRCREIPHMAGDLPHVHPILAQPSAMPSPS